MLHNFITQNGKYGKSLHKLIDPKLDLSSTKTENKGYVQRDKFPFRKHVSLYISQVQVERDPDDCLSCPHYSLLSQDMLNSDPVEDSEDGARRSPSCPQVGD